ncbi:hypothetical protein [Microvirga thermotolerans]|uniref:Lectin-like protein BA14k n=1 Tax=Microvirga thermotolerans TaxID=2651334 RepID=A0A5P9JRV3_9HYPH|nr:hypothetical protein [Microvirga thermotolerans]QFU14799.1 hypothetical protein GDR74_00430 [Microvirga thermotolerans]
MFKLRSVRCGSPVFASALVIVLTSGGWASAGAVAPSSAPRHAMPSVERLLGAAGVDGVYARAVGRGARGGFAARGRYGAVARGPRGGVAVRGPYRTAVRGPRGNVAVTRTGSVRRPVAVAPGWRRPAAYWWRPGGALAAGAAVGVLSAAAARSYIGAAPAPGYCWYYTNASRTRGFWDVCPR